MEQLGAYIVKVSRTSSAVTEDLPKAIVTSDPTGFITGRKVTGEDFEEIDRIVSNVEET